MERPRWHVLCARACGRVAGRPGGCPGAYSSGVRASMVMESTSTSARMVPTSAWRLSGARPAKLAALASSEGQVREKSCSSCGCPAVRVRLRGGGSHCVFLHSY